MFAPYTHGLPYWLVMKMGFTGPSGEKNPSYTTAAQHKLSLVTATADYLKATVRLSLESQKTRPWSAGMVPLSAYAGQRGLSVPIKPLPRPVTLEKGDRISGDFQSKAVVVGGTDPSGRLTFGCIADPDGAGSQEVAAPRHEAENPYIVELTVPFNGSVGESVERDGPSLSRDFLIYGAVSPLNYALVRLMDTRRGYRFSTDYVPISALAGTTSTTYQTVLWPTPYLLEAYSPVRVEAQNNPDNVGGAAEVANPIYLIGEFFQ